MASSPGLLCADRMMMREPFLPQFGRRRAVVGVAVCLMCLAASGAFFLSSRPDTHTNMAGKGRDDRSYGDS